MIGVKFRLMFALGRCLMCSIIKQMMPHNKLQYYRTRAAAVK